MEATIRRAWSLGVAPILFFGPGTTWNDDAIVALGGADFLRRPYEPDDAFARIKLALTTSARQTAESSRVLEIAGLELDPVKRELSYDGRKVTLRRAECNVLVRLLRVFPNPVSQVTLVEEVLGAHGSGATARNQIYELRRKLAAIGAGPFIETVHGSSAYRIRHPGDIAKASR